MTLPVVPVSDVALGVRGASHEQGAVVAASRRRRRRRCGCRAATTGRCRPVRPPPRRSPGAAAAAGPSPAPRAGRCRRTSASKSAASSRKPPGRRGGVRRRPVVQAVQVPAPVGGEGADARRGPSATRRHRSSGEATPPGKRQAMPTTAIGSRTRSSVCRSRSRRSRASAMARLRYSRSLCSPALPGSSDVLGIRASLSSKWGMWCLPGGEVGPRRAGRCRPGSGQPSSVVDHGEEVVVGGRVEVVVGVLAGGGAVRPTPGLQHLAESSSRCLRSGSSWETAPRCRYRPSSRASASCAGEAWGGASSARSSSASAWGVGWSKTRVAGSRSPVAAPRLLRSSTAVRESKPSSRKVRSGAEGVG